MSLLAREGVRRPINQPSDDIVTYSALDLIGLMRAGDLSPVEVTDAFLARADNVQQTLNPFSFLLRDEARLSARRAEARLRREPEACGLLEGLPVAIKELTPVEGQPHTLSCLSLRENVAASTDPAVARLSETGGILFARTNSPEFGCASFTDSLLFGETLNPWDSAMSPAGSSGGAAAALASHATPLAQGSDTAGSLRLPAAACGIVGMKPSWGVVPQSPPRNLEMCSHNGPMARSVSDLRLMFDVMAGPDPVNLSGLMPFDFDAQVDLTGTRVGLIDSMPDIDVDTDVATNLSRVGNILEEAGAHVERHAFPWSYSRLFETVRMNFAQYYGPMIRRVLDSQAELSDYSRAFALSLVDFTDDYTVNLSAREQKAELHANLAELFNRYDYLLMPTLAAPAPPAGEHFLERGPIVNGREQPDRWMVAFTVPFNIVSSCPVVSVPTGLSSTGIPTAAQVIANPYHDYSVLSLAEQLETLLDDNAASKI